MSVGQSLLLGVVLPFAVLGVVYGLGRFGLLIHTSVKAAIIYLSAVAAYDLVIGLALVASSGISVRASVWVLQGILWAGFAVQLSRRHKAKTGEGSATKQIAPGPLSGNEGR